MGWTFLFFQLVKVGRGWALVFCPRWSFPRISSCYAEIMRLWCNLPWHRPTHRKPVAVIAWTNLPAKTLLYLASGPRCSGFLCSTACIYSNKAFHAIWSWGMCLYYEDLRLLWWVQTSLQHQIMETILCLRLKHGLKRISQYWSHVKPPCPQSDHWQTQKISIGHYGRHKVWIDSLSPRVSAQADLLVGEAMFSIACQCVPSLMILVVWCRGDVISLLGPNPARWMPFKLCSCLNIQKYHGVSSSCESILNDEATFRNLWS